MATQSQTGNYFGVLDDDSNGNTYCIGDIEDKITTKEMTVADTEAEKRNGKANGKAKTNAKGKTVGKTVDKERVTSVASMMNSVGSIISSLDITTMNVACDVTPMQMKVRFAEVFSDWPNWLIQNRAFTDDNERTEFIADCLLAISSLLMSIQTNLTASEQMEFAKFPVVIRKNAAVPTESYSIHDDDFIKVYGALQWRLSTFVKNLRSDTKPGKRHTLQNLSEKTALTKQRLYRKLEDMKYHTDDNRAKFFEEKAKKQNKKKQEFVEKKMKIRKQVIQDLDGWITK